MEKKFIKATFNVREEVEAALGHESAQKWPRTDVYAQRWLQREVDGGVGRSRMTPETDWTRDMMLARLIEEVRLERDAPDAHAYNRMHNRHNRSTRRPYPPPPTPGPRQEDS